MGEWNFVSLSELVADGAAGFASGPFGSSVSTKNFTSDGVPMLRGTNLSDKVGEKLCEDDFVFVPPVLAEKFRRAIVQAGDLVFTSWGTVGQVGLISQNSRYQRYLLSNKQMKMTPDPGRVSPLFLYYYLSQRSVVAQVQGQAIGSSVPGFNLGQLKRLAVKVPLLTEQRAIAEVLGALDDKIAANERALSVGDSLVRAEFARLSGKPMTLENLMTSVREQVDPTSRPGATPYVGLEHVPRRRMWLQEFGSANMVSSAKSSFREGDVLFGKLRPYFHKVVRAAFSGIASTDILVLRAKRPELAGLALAAASSDGAVAAATGTADGTRMPRANWSVLKEVRVPWPGDAEAVRFSCRVDSIARLAAGLTAETRALGSTRDELLPLLMSGRLRVKDAEEVVAGVV